MNKPLILIVEDDKPIRNLISLTLESQQYRQIAVETGSAAVLASLSQKPDIMILDLGLPDPWVAIAGPTIGTDGDLLLLLDTNAQNSQKFYRVSVSLP